jgi:hypothetical protein
MHPAEEYHLPDDRYSKPGRPLEGAGVDFMKQFRP